MQHVLLFCFGLWMVCAHRTNESRLTKFNNADIEVNMNHRQFHYRVQHFSSFEVKKLRFIIKRIDAGPFWLPMHVLVSINCGLICVRLCCYIFHLIFVLVETAVFEHVHLRFYANSCCHSFIFFGIHSFVLCSFFSLRSIYCVFPF